MNNDILLLLGMMAVTFLPRYIPIAFANKLRLPDMLTRALHYVPIAVLTVIILQTSVFKGGELNLTINNPFIWATLAAAITARVQSRMLLTIIVGMLVFAAVSAL